MFRILTFFCNRSESPNAEYVLSGTEDNIVAYRIVHVPDDSPKNNQTIHTNTATLNNSVTTTVPQQLQYIVIDSSNGFLQAVPTTQITAVPTAPLKVEQATNNSCSNSLKMRTSVAIAPKVDPIYLPPTQYTTTTTMNHTTSAKSNVRYVKTTIVTHITDSIQTQ